MSPDDLLVREPADPRPAAPLADLCWPDLAFDKADLADIGVRAFCWLPSGDLWEYECGAFFVTSMSGDRRRVWDETRVPFGPWSHHATCACAACRVTND